MVGRLQKLISQAGLASRRQAEEWIASGRVAVNGVTAALGQCADLALDTVTVDGKALPREEKKVYIMLNKPRGYVTTASDEKGRKTVMELLEGVEVRVYPVGRLDMFSEGLLLLTNDGELAKRLTHPSHGVEKVYQVRVTGDVAAALPVLCAPMRLDGRLLKPVKVQLLSRSGEAALLRFTLSQGINRQIRRMCEMAGLRVVRLRRVAEGGLRLGELPRGAWRYLTEEETESLHSS